MKIDKNKVIIMGDSAGGNLAAVMAQKFKKQFKAQVLIYPWMQMADYQLPSYTNMAGFENDPTVNTKYLLTPKEVAKYTLSYLKGQDYTKSGADKDLDKLVAGNHLKADVRTKDPFKFLKSTHDYSKVTYDATMKAKDDKLIGDLVMTPDVSPLFQTNVAGLSDAYVLTVEVDALRDEGKLYYERLKAAGNAAEYIDYPKPIMHGDIRKADVPKAVDMLKGVITFIEKKLK